MWEEILQCHDQRVFDSLETVRKIRIKDAEVAGKNVLAARPTPDGPVLPQSAEPSDNFILPPQMEVQNSLPEQVETQDSADISLKKEGIVENNQLLDNCSEVDEEERLENNVAQYCSDADDLDPLESVREGDANNYRNYGLNLQCSQEVTYVRRCGYSKKIKFSEARHMTAECRQIVTTKLPTCMHVLHVSCHLIKQLSAWRPWQERTQSIKLLHDESVVVATLRMPSGACQPALESILKDRLQSWLTYQAPVRFSRTFLFGHDSEMTCCNAFKILKGKQSPSPCHARVLKSLKYGHKVAMKCCEDVAKLRCQKSVEKPCWNVQSCGAKVTVPCTMAATSELGKGHFGQEAMTTLVAAMTDPMYVGIVIVITWYRKDMDQMLDRNVGLKSRFRSFIDFEDWEAQDAVVFLSEKTEAESFEVESETVVVLKKTFVELRKLSYF
ncbi:hypothetical protein PsorP6_010628 [Peronosclerospora sorghi]|uniref:Uncharacterized protein n=1 Tax=Peronosclerospora sorghi TaxID=230839 RepID=A0ACC0VVT5_9STRA|nr:hypothetical protein PsorP6_010628 [Peronosclerospora sorghi]